METINSYSYEDLVEEAMSMLPPLRTEGMGITAQELQKRAGNIGISTAREKLTELGLVPVEMRNGRAGRKTAYVYLKPEDAEKYKDWIVETP